MKAILIVIKNEIITKLTQKSFLFAAFGLPLVGFIIFGIVLTINRNSPQLVDDLARNPTSVEIEGYVDKGGLIDTVPGSISQDLLIGYPDEVSAQRALDRGEIGAYYIIPPDYLENGQVTYVRPDFSPLSATAQRDLITSLLAVNLLEGKAELAARIDQPFVVQETALEPPSPRDEDNPLSFILPYAITLMLYLVIFGTASHNISSLTTEKENQVIEILLTSITPQQMFTGKIIGLGIVGLLQAVVWLGSSFMLIRITGQSVELPAQFQLSTSLIVWGMIFFVLGYGLYASLLASVGALVPNLREAAQAAFVINSPLIIPLILIGILVSEPSGPISTTLSLFPFTAPVVMMTRLTVSPDVPVWQILLAILLLLLTIILIIRSVSRLFRAQTLLSGQSFSLRRFFGALLGQT